MMGLAGAIALTYLLGYVVLSLCASHGAPWQTDLAMRTALAFGCGAGISAGCYIFLYFFAPGHTGKVFLLEGLTLALLWLAGRWSRGTGTASGSALGLPRADRVIVAAAVLCAVVGVVRYVHQTVRHPNGETDAFTMWNVRARYLHAVSTDPKSAFEPSFNTRGYPFMLPAFVARCWKAAGSDSAVVPAIVGFLFASSTALLLFAALRRSGGSNQACLGLITLLSAPTFIFHSASQYADAVVGFYMLAAVVIACATEGLTEAPRQVMALVGLLVGLAVWIKNEGHLFFVAFTSVMLLVGLLSERWKNTLTRFTAYCCSAIPLIVLLICFKRYIALPSDAVAVQAGWQVYVASLLNGTRMLQILAETLELFVYFSVWPSILPLIVVYGMLVGFDFSPRRRRAVIYCAATLTLMCVGHFLAYLLIEPIWGTSPKSDLYFGYWLEYSAFRLLVQLWPLIIFLSFLLIRPPEESGQASAVTVSGLE